MDEGGAAEIEFVGDPFAVRFDGVFRKAKVFGNFPIGAAFSDECENLLLPVGKLRVSWDRGFGLFRARGIHQQVELLLQN